MNAGQSEPELLAEYRCGAADFLTVRGQKGGFAALTERLDGRYERLEKPGRSL